MQIAQRAVGKGAKRVMPKRIHIPTKRRRAGFRSLALTTWLLTLPRSFADQ